MFASATTHLNVAFGDAQASLTRLIRGDSLWSASSAAYGEGTSHLARAGLQSPMLKALRLDKVRCLEPVLLDAFAHLAVRWEVVGHGGPPFPLLDASIVLVPHPQDGTVVGVSGAYRHPPGMSVAELNRTQLQGAAEATVRAFARHIGVAILIAARPAERQ